MLRVTVSLFTPRFPGIPREAPGKPREQHGDDGPLPTLREGPGLGIDEEVVGEQCLPRARRRPFVGRSCRGGRRC